MPVASVSGLRVCICTPDYVHLVKNGGIGTSCQHTAKILTDFGADVTVLYANRTVGMTEEGRRRAATLVADEGSQLEFLFPQDDRALLKQFHPNDIYTVTAYLAYQWLKTKSFDVIIFADWRGVGYFAVHARRQGLAFSNTQLWVQGHSTMLWHELNNDQTRYTEDDVRGFHYERKTIELCDRLIVATQYLFDWMLAHGFIFPKQAEVLPLLIDANLMSGSRGEHTVEIAGSAGPIEELVFFGRLERRKGLALFLQALQRMKRYHPSLLHRFRVTFLGKVARVDGLNSIDFIERGMEGLGIEYSINVSLSSEEAISYLQARPVLAVMPSLTDNSPLTVLECMNAGVRFIAAKTGGIPEIVREADHAAVLVAPFAPPLTEAIVQALQRGQPLAQPACNQTGSNVPRWLEALASVKTAAPTESARGRLTPRVSVCITHYNRPRMLATTLDGLEAQTYKNFEVLLVDNDSPDPHAIAFVESVAAEYPSLDIRSFKLRDLYAGAARNHALQEAEGEYLIFMDDDNFAHPQQIETFVGAICTSGFDALSCALIAFPEEDDPRELLNFMHLFVPAGSGLSLNLFGNSYGDANGIYRKSAVQAVGGFTEERASWEDYELYSRMETSGYKVGVVPEPLMYLRYTSGGVSRSGSMIGNYYRALRPALDHLPWGTYGDALLVALNGPLQAYEKMRFDAASSRDDDLIQRNSDQPFVIARVLARRKVEGGKTRDALRELERLANSAPSLEPLHYDVLFGTAMLDGLAGVRRQAEGGSLAKVADAFVSSFETYAFEPLTAALEQLAERRVLTPDETYLSGLAALASSDGPHALERWASMLDEAEASYLLASGDVGDGVKLGHLRSGLFHYVRWGAAEGRPFSYTAPIHQPYSDHVASSPSDHVARLESALSAPTDIAAHQLGQLLLDIVAGGNILSAADFARRVLEEAERRYLAENGDVRIAITKGDVESGLSHWCLNGREENRSFLLSKIVGDDFGRVLIDKVRAQYDRSSAGSVTFAGSFVQDLTFGLVDRGTRG